jgi:hypothetical protein
MSNLMYQGSAQTFTHHLKNLSAILKVAAANAKARGIDPAVLLGARLAPDMFPLTRQVQVMSDNAKGCCARLAGVQPPVFEDTEATFAELEARIKRTLDFIRSLKPAIVMKMPIGTLSFNGADYLNGWALPNFYFHYTAVYSILRHNGVPLGKMNFLGQVPGMQMTGKIAKMMGAKPGAKAKKKS